MTLQLINGVPATTEGQQARRFATRLAAGTEVIDNDRLYEVISMLAVLPQADEAGTTIGWVIYCRPGARTIGKYVAEITVIDTTGRDAS